MASAPQAQSLPLFYKDLVPINKQEHGNWHSRQTDKATWLVNQHAVPLTVEEFPAAGRHFPIVFSAGDDTVPLALMGMNEGVNVFVEDDGSLRSPIYMPAYARRYPFLLAKLDQSKDDLSLCFDPTSDLIGEFDDGLPLFEDGEPTEACKATLDFCEQFEIAGSKTGNFIQEIRKHDLLIDGELSIQLDGQDQPLMYRGFQMVDENKLRELRGDVLRGWNQNGLLPLIYAHLFSLELVRDIFARQTEQGKVPKLTPNITIQDGPQG
jgi:hypothetical protein